MLRVPIKFDRNTLIERHAVLVLQLLDSLKRNNIRRLLQRGGSAGKTWSTRKNLRDLLGSINNSLLYSTFDFKRPFEFYGEEIASTVF